MSTVVVVEFLEGYDGITDGERFLEPFQWIDVTPGVARKASQVRRSPRRTGTMIGDFDILIGATALELGSPLATANVGHYSLIAGLDVIRYR